MTDLHLIALLKKHGWKLHTRSTLINWTKERLIDEIECLENNWGVSLEREEISFEYKKELVEENEQLKKKISYLEDNLRVARKDNEDLRNDIANGLKEFVKELPFTSMRLLANKEVKEENELLQQKWLESEYEKSKLVSQIEKMKCCANCDYWFDMDSTCELHKETIADFMIDCDCKDWKCAYKEVAE